MGWGIPGHTPPQDVQCWQLLNAGSYGSFLASISSMRAWISSEVEVAIPRGRLYDSALTLLWGEMGLARTLRHHSGAFLAGVGG